MRMVWEYIHQARHQKVTHKRGTVEESDKIYGHTKKIVQPRLT